MCVTPATSCGRPMTNPTAPMTSSASKFRLIWRIIRKHRSRRRDTDPEQLLGKVAIANAKLAYQSFKRFLESDRWQRLASRGARVQRMLWASTSTKNPAYHDLLYVEPLIGPMTVNTMPQKTIA